MKIHVERSFVRAQADIIATGSYQLNVDNLKQQLGLNNQEAEEILFNSVRLAQKVIGQKESILDDYLNAKRIFIHRGRRKKMFSSRVVWAVRRYFTRRKRI